MKKHIFIALICILLVVSSLIPMTAVAENADTQDRIVSETSYGFKELGYSYGDATSHGNNQTRIAYTSSGVYVSYPLNDFESEYDEFAHTNLSGAYYSLYHVSPDGKVRELFRDKLFWVAAGTTTNVMVDKNEDIWVCTSWDEGSGLYGLVAWHYDVKADKATRYSQSAIYRFGGAYGKPVSIMDAENNVIYQVSCGGQKSPGYMIWTTFDMETNTWNKMMTYKKTSCSCCYHFGYATGKGGFFIVTTRTHNNFEVDSGYKGLNVHEAMKELLNRPSIDVGQVWDETHLFYVPDASQAEVFEISFGEAEYDAPRGIYPTVVNRSSSILYDENTGLLYALRQEDDCGTVGIHMMLYVLDTHFYEKDPHEDAEFFTWVAKKELVFSYGPGMNYYPGLVQDTTGQIYIIVGTERSGEIEIWKAVDEKATEYEFVYTFACNEEYSKEDFHQWKSLIVANNRNNSMRSDLTYVLYEDGQGWESFAVNFAALRAHLEES